MGHLIEAYISGGFMMHFISVVAIFSAAISLERFIVLFFKMGVDKEKFMGNVQRAILAGDLNSAVNYCNDRQGPLNAIVKAGIISVMNKGSNEEVQTSMDVAALREIPYIEKRTSWLPLLANVSTLLGLLATIEGLIAAFSALGGVDPAQKALYLAQAIAIAMNGTYFGLVVAIPTLLSSAMLNSKTQNLLDDIHELSVSTLNLIIQNREKFK
ncbi:MAG: MotA/TolQ/ExbB proton channel family protein [Proteobacteria bacterium]|jgi:biopolymer transport protein ExbB/TolQ|nr:MotA/TolQ/ExbB proton channel family protein [Pseudomonadota bacterium]